MNISEKIEYWVKIAEMDVSVMHHLFQSGDYNYSLFIGHLILEKILKAHYIKKHQETPPRVHDLVKIAKSTDLVFHEEQIKFLITINTFNIEARYPDEKLKFYKMCTKEFANENIIKIEELFKWLKSLI